MEIHNIKKLFPLFTHQPDLVYLDSAATALKPASVVAAEAEYYENYCSNIARGIYPMAEQATEAFEKTRGKIAALIGAHSEEIIFTSGTTASLNLVADLLASQIHKGDNIVVTAAEHHSNFLPWKELCKRTGATFNILPITRDGTLDMAALPNLINDHTKIFALGAISNVLGIINPVADIIRSVRAKNPETRIVVDAAQAVGHIPIDVTTWDVDFLAFSGHKMFGPTGTGVLFGKEAILKNLSPVSFGGGMVLDACAPETLYKDAPARFESGTPNIAGIIGLGAAVDFIQGIGLDHIRTHELALIGYTYQKLEEAFGEALHIVGNVPEHEKSGIISFTLTGVHPHDVAYLLGEKNICVRAGLQCAAPLHEALDLSASTRISLSVYTTESDIDRLVSGLREIRTIL